MKYKVGDKVRIVNVTDHRKDYIGRVVTIDRINPNGHTIYKPTITHYGMSERNIHYVFWEDELELAKIEFPKIVITTDGTETLARLYEGGKVVKSATAKCSPEDSFDAYIGAKIAFDRLLAKPLAEEPDKPKFFTGKAVCLKGDKTFTVGKIYDFVDGKTTDNIGGERPQGFRVDSTFEIWKKTSCGLYDFLPLVESEVTK